MIAEAKGLLHKIERRGDVFLIHGKIIYSVAYVYEEARWGILVDGRVEMLFSNREEAVSIAVQAVQGIVST